MNITTTTKCKSVSAITQAPLVYKASQTIRHIRLLYLCVLVLLSYSCKQDGGGSSLTDSSTFTLKGSAETGVTFTNTLNETDELNIIEYLYYYNGGGVAVGDINGDGLEDIYFAANQQADQLYLNKGNFKFEDISEQAGISRSATWSSGVTMADLTGDGLVDIYVCKVAPLNGDSVANELYVNNGDGTFQEQAAEYGLDFAGYSTQAAVLDYDGDGDLDLYLLNHTVHSVRSYGNITKRTEKDARSGDQLLENKISEGAGFVNVSDAAGIYSSPLGYGLAVACADVNGDGLVDIYVGNDFHENDYLYLNNGDKTFTESVGTAMSHTSQFSMGVDIADINGDGYEDIFTTDMLPYDSEVLLVSGGEDTDQVKRIKDELGFENQYARNHMQLGKGNNTWSDVAYYTKTYATDWSWSVLLQDFTNDGTMDVFVSNGIVRRPNDLDYINYLNEYDQYKKGDQATRTADLLTAMPQQPLHNLLLQQESELRFSDVHDSKLGDKSYSTGAAYADFDLDGDLDIVTNNINAEAFIMENISAGNYIGVQLQDSAATVHGSLLVVYAGDETYHRQLHVTKGFMSTSTAYLHVGLPAGVTIDSMIVSWPDGSTQHQLAPEVGQYHVIAKGAAEPKRSTSRSSMTYVLEQTEYRHRDNRYYDEQQEKLIPERLAYEGPAMLCEDLNGDGYDDLYLGGGREQAAQLLLGNASGQYIASSQQAFVADAKYEDVAVASIDFDKDGDQDLYVSSGGNDAKELDKRLEDRLYLNNNGDFRRIPLSLPHTNGSTVSVADFDGDGYEDLFVGARSIPGSYGLVPYSFVLTNKKGQGVDIAYKVRMGMLTDSEWADIDSDGDSDLLICGDWMPVRVFENEGGVLTERTSEYGLSNSTGLWNAILTTDINNDGKLDIIAANAGLNQKWKATAERPVKMYVGDYDSNGSSEALIFADYFGEYVPVASFDMVASQLPMLKKKYNSYKQFSTVSNLNALLGTDTDLTVETRQVSELRSMQFVSTKDGYLGEPLPGIVQMNDIQDIVATVDGSLWLCAGPGESIASIGAGAAPILYRISDSELVTTVPLPVDSSPRAMVAVGDTTPVVGTNNDYYISVVKL